MTKEQQRNWTMVAGGIVVLFGMAMLVRGVWLAWRPGGWMVAGLLIAAPGLFVAYNAFREKQ